MLGSLSAGLVDHSDVNLCTHTAVNNHVKQSAVTYECGCVNCILQQNKQQSLEMMNN